MNRVKKYVSMLLIFMFLAGLVPLGRVAAAEGTMVLKDGEYSVGYKYYKDNTNEPSVTDDYGYPGTGVLIVKGNTYYFEHDMKFYHYFGYFASRKPGQPKAVIAQNNKSASGAEGYEVIASTKAEGGEDRTKVRILIEDYNKRQDLLMHILIPGINYDNWYNAQLELDLSKIPSSGEDDDLTMAKKQLEQMFTDAHTLYENAKEGTGNGSYPVGSKKEFESAIHQAQELAANAGDDIQLIRAVYAFLNEAYTKFVAKKIVTDRAALLALIDQVDAIVDSVKNAGTAEGTPNRGAAVAGEYPPGTSNSLRGFLGAAKGAAGDLDASQAVIDETFKNLKEQFDALELKKFVESTGTITMINSIGEDAQISEYAKEIDPASTLLRGQDPYRTTHANIAFLLEQNPTEVSFASPTAAGGFNPSSLSAAKKSALNSTASRQVYQITPRHDIAKDEVYQGLAYLEYTIEGVKREVYISFNSAQLAQLNKAILEAQELHDKAVEGSDSGEYAEGSKAVLQVKIDEVKKMGGNLAATRPQIANASEVLQNAVQQFKSQLVPLIYFTAVHETAQAFSSMDSYMVKPAKVNFSNGKAKVELTVKDSTTVTEFKIKQGENYVPAAVVSEDKEKNTRVVSFEVNDLGKLVDARVRTVVPSQNYDREHNIRLNFNNVDNTALFSLINAANAKLRAAVTGTEPGQYTEAAKAVLKAAVDEANTEAVSLSATPETSAAATAKLKEAVALFERSDNKNLNPLNTLIASAQSAHDSANEGTSVNQYKAGSKQKLQAAIGVAKESAANPVNQNQINEAAVKLQAALDAFQASKNFSTGNYNATLKSSSPAFAGHIQGTAELAVGAQTSKLTITPKPGVTVKKLINQTTNEEILPVGSMSPAAVSSQGFRGTAALLALTSGASVPVQFEVKDLSSPYSLVIEYIDNEQVKETSYTVQLANITSKTTPYYPGGNSGVVVGTSDKYYYIDFKVLKEGTAETSMMQSYVVPKALVKESGSSKTVQFTVKQSSAIKVLTIDGHEVADVSKNEAADTRVVSVSLTDLSAKLKATVKLSIPAQNYNSEHTVQFVFDTASVKAADANAAVPGVETTGTTVQTPDKGNETQEPETDFADIKGHWAQAEIGKAVTLGIATGYADGTFRPDGVITRAEFVSLLSRALKLEAGKEAAFQDASRIPAWAREHVAKAASAGLIGGYSDQTFRPDQQISRAELAVIITRAAKLETGKSAALSFADAGLIPGWAQAEIAAAVQAGLIQGKGGNTFDPSAAATRAEALALIIKLLDEK